MERNEGNDRISYGTEQKTELELLQEMVTLMKSQIDNMARIKRNILFFFYFTVIPIGFYFLSIYVFKTKF